MALKELINELKRKYPEYPASGFIAALKLKYADFNSDIPVNETCAECAVFNREYVTMAIEKLKDLKEILLSRDYKNFKEKLENIIEEDDWDDPEDVIEAFNDAVIECIYKSFSKVSPGEKFIIDKYLKEVGYKKILIPEGASIKKYTDYFAQTFPEKTENKENNNLIKDITSFPYHIFFEINETHTEKILEGNAVVYKYNI